MKSYLQLSLAAVLVVMVFGNCTRRAGAPRTTAAYYLSATSGTIGSFYSSGSDVNASGAAGAKIEIDGVAPSGRRFVVYINPYSGTTGTIPLGTSGISGCEYLSPPGVPDTVISSVHGTLTLTAVTPDITGSFSFTGADSSLFTGSFDVAAP